MQAIRSSFLGAVVLVAACSTAAPPPADDGMGPITKRMTVGETQYLVEWRQNFQVVEGGGEGFVPLVAVSRAASKSFVDSSADKAEAYTAAKAFCARLGYKWSGGDLLSSFYLPTRADRIRPPGRSDWIDVTNKAEWTFSGPCAPRRDRR